MSGKGFNAHVIPTTVRWLLTYNRILECKGQKGSKFTGGKSEEEGDWLVYYHSTS